MNDYKTILAGIPGAIEKVTAQTLNKLAGAAAKRAVSTVAKAEKLPFKPVSRRVRLKKATAKEPVAVLRINPRDMPAIRGGKVRAVRASGGRRGGTFAGNGNFYEAGFRQVIKYGSQILERTGRKKWVTKNGKRVKVDELRVVKIPLAGALKTAFEAEKKNADVAAEISLAIKTKFDGGL